MGLSQFISGVAGDTSYELRLVSELSLTMGRDLYNIARIKEVVVRVIKFLAKIILGREVA